MERAYRSELESLTNLPTKINAKRYIKEMSWKKLKELIQSMDKDRKGKKKGEAFEKLVAKLLEMLLEKSFVVAKSGTQPSGDARSVDGAIAIQAKNYSDRSSLKDVEIVGDIYIVKDNLQDLQVYVLVVSRTISAQTLGKLEKIEKDIGLDIVCIELSDDLSDLGALCVKFWDDIWIFFGTSDTSQDQEFLTWIGEMKNDAETEKKLVELKLKMKQGLHTQIHFKKEAQEKLLMCIGDETNSSSRSHCLINLSKVKNRPVIESKLENWWKKAPKPVCYLEGEKDSGKTWIAAKWVSSIYNDKNTVSIWLESDDWDNCESLDELLAACFKSIYSSQNERKISKLKHKFCNTWGMSTLIILDGLSDQKASTGMKRILREYFGEYRRGQSKWGHKIRLLLTTIPINEHQISENNIWRECYPIQVEPFSDHKPDMTPISDVPQSIFLKNLWENLLERIENTDSHVRVDLGWSESEKAQEILARLAKQTKWTIVDSATQFSVQLLKNCFANYRETRHDLEKQSVTLEVDEIHVEVNQDHVKLGWALYLSNLFDSLKFTTIKDFSDRFHRELDPFLTEDPRTEALFLALQITAIFPKIAQTSFAQKRTALLLVLFNCSNPVLTQERLLFWAEQDTEAYVQFVQSAFKNHNLPYEEEAIVGPLSHTWYHKNGQVDSIASCLTNWLSRSDTEKGGNINHEENPFPTMYYTQNRLSAAALSILSQRPERQFLRSLAHCYEYSKANAQIKQDIGKLMRWGYTEDVLEDLRSLVEKAQTDETLLTGVHGLADELNLINLPQRLQRPLSEEDKEIRAAVEQWNSSFKPYISRIRDQEQLLKGDSPSANVEGNYHGLDYLAVRKDLLDLRDDDLVKIKEVLQYISENTKLGQHVDATLEDYCIQNLIPWVAKNDPEGYAELACNLKLNTLNQKWAQFKLLSIQGLIFTDKDCEKISTAILGMKERLAQGEDFYSDIAWLTHLLTESLLFCAPDDVLVDWFTFLASQEPLRSSICYKSLPYLFDRLSPASIVELAQQKLEEFRSSSHENHNLSNNEAEEFSEEKFWCTLFAYGSEVEEKTVEYALEDLKMRKPDSTGTFPMLRLAFSDPKRFLDETLIDERIQRHLFSQNSRRWKIRTYEGKNVPSYELLRTFLPIEIIGAFLCAPGRQDDLSRWGKDLIGQMCSMLQGDKENINSVEENRFGINRGVLQTWAEQNQTDFLNLSHEYLIGLSKSPSYQQPLSDFTDVIHCLLLRFQPEKAMKFYQQWSAESVRTIFSNEYGIETLLAQLWKVEQCNSPKHVQLRRTLLEECQNDEEIMFMTIAALAGGGKEELWNLVTHEFLKSHYAKERNLGVSILPWFGTDDAVELLENLKSNDKSWWVRNHAAWAYEIAQQERSCREVYRETLQTRDLFRISAVFEQMIPALSPTAKWWHYQIEEKVELYKESQDNDPKLHALVYRFWYRWGNSSKTKRNVEIWGRKLSEYCRGEKLGFGSPPRLAPWWKPE